MKNILSMAVLATALFLTSCNDQDDTIISGNGNLGIEFDNAYGNNDLILGAANGANSNQETLKINFVRYLVSNIVLTDAKGNTFTYPKNDSYFIVDESDAASLVLDLQNIPAADYVKVQFGIGVDQAQYDLGLAAQGSLLERATAAGLYSNWEQGYQFLSVSGSFSSGSQPEAPFSITTAKTASHYNYQQITLDLPTKALVRTDITPEIHIIADLSKLTDGANKLKLSEGATIDSGEKVVLVSQNIAQMFTVAHVHND